MTGPARYHQHAATHTRMKQRRVPETEQSSSAAQGSWLRVLAAVQAPRTRLSVQVGCCGLAVTWNFVRAKGCEVCLASVTNELAPGAGLSAQQQAQLAGCICGALVPAAVARETL
jgi:hypothetical protein